MDEFRFLRCYACRRIVPPFEVTHGPLCGPTETHPACADVVWHDICRVHWLADLAIWDEVADTDSGVGRLGPGVDKGGTVSTIHAPFTDRQVAELNRYQVADIMHPFTCPNDGHVEEVVLLATTDGWYCPVRGCGFRQDWAHSFMADA